MSQEQPANNAGEVATPVQHILSARQFDTEQISEIFDRADYMREQVASNRRQLAQRHLGNVVSTIFYEPSTRTHKSFKSAGMRLGMGVSSTDHAGLFSSAVKGEILEDTIRTEEKYAELIVLRHNETGAADRAAAVASVPIINAGDGGGEHPTQALLDLYTISKEKGRTDNLNVVIGGDLVKGRTARSLALLLSHYPGNHLTFVSLPELKMRDDIKQHLEQAGATYEETDDMFGALQGADVVYWTRLQLERHGGGKKTEAPASGWRKAAGLFGRRQKIVSPTLEQNYIIDQAALQTMEDDAIIMHPLPRNNEIEQSVDGDPRAKYFDQVENGLYIRMALLDMLLEQSA